MLGWEFAIYRPADGGGSPGNGESVKGECVGSLSDDAHADE